MVSQSVSQSVKLPSVNRDYCHPPESSASRDPQQLLRQFRWSWVWGESGESWPRSGECDVFQQVTTLQRYHTTFPGSITSHPRPPPISHTLARGNFSRLRSARNNNNLGRTKHHGITPVYTETDNLGQTIIKIARRLIFLSVWLSVPF